MNVCAGCGKSFEGLFCPWCKTKFTYDSGDLTLRSYDDHDDDIPVPAKQSEGLLFRDAGAECFVRGIGICADSDICVPAKHSGKPVVAIDAWAFHNLGIVTGITILPGVRRIGAFAFFGCGTLARITIPDSVTEICNSAFDGCTALSRVYFCGGKTDWDRVNMGLHNDAIYSAVIYFYSESVHVGGGNFWHYGEDGKPAVW